VKGKRKGTREVRASLPDLPDPHGRQATDDQQPVTLGEVLDELAFARAWRAEHADAD
jgi:hypothetical protein